MVTVQPLRIDDADACDAIIAGHPYHFAIEEGRRLCAAAVRSEQGLVAVELDRPVGFLTFVHRFEHATEITWMAVRSDRRRTGIGRALIDALVAELRASNKRLLLVLTVSPTDDEDGPEDGYAATRAFYAGMAIHPRQGVPRRVGGRHRRHDGAAPLRDPSTRSERR